MASSDMQTFNVQAPATLSAPQLEVIALDVDDALRAQAGGADRVEVVSAIHCGGLTPSAALVQGVARRCTVLQMVMLRPHDRSFVYTDDEMVLIREAVAMARDAGAHGLVFGALTSAGAVDTVRLEQVLRWADGMPLTFHRAFDAAADLRQAFTVLGRYRGAITQVLTSGGQPKASAGREILRELVERWRAGEGVEPLIGAGVDASTLVNLRRHTGARQFHVGVGARSSSTYGLRVDALRVARLRNLLDSAAMP
jgi:copper homeostasis protein